MFSDITVALLFALGAGAWIYAKAYRSSGGNTRNALVVAGGLAVVIFLAVFTILKFIFHS